MDKKELRAYLGLALMTLIIGLSFIFIKVALVNAKPVDILAHRFSTAAVAILLYYIFIRKRKPKIKPADVLPLLLLVLFYPIFLFMFQALGLQFTTASEAGILTALAPILTLVLAAVLLKEKSNTLQILSVLLSVAGVVFIMYKNGVNTLTPESLKGDFLILLSVVSMAFYFVLGRMVNRRLDAMDITLFMTLTAAVVFNIYALYSHIQHATLANYFIAFKDSSFLWSILYLGVLSTVVTSFLTNNALKVIPASQVSIFNNMSPIITVFAGVIILNETLFYYHIIGGLLVLLGIVGVNLRKVKS